MLQLRDIHMSENFQPKPESDVISKSLSIGLKKSGFEKSLSVGLKKFSLKKKSQSSSRKHLV